MLEGIKQIFVRANDEKRLVLRLGISGAAVEGEIGKDRRSLLLSVSESSRGGKLLRNNDRGISGDVEGQSAEIRLLICRFYA